MYAGAPGGGVQAQPWSSTQRNYPALLVIHSILENKLPHGHVAAGYGSGEVRKKTNPAVIPRKVLGGSRGGGGGGGRTRLEARGGTPRSAGEGEAIFFASASCLSVDHLPLQTPSGGSRRSDPPRAGWVRGAGQHHALSPTAKLGGPTERTRSSSPPLCVDFACDLAIIGRMAIVFILEPSVTFTIRETAKRWSRMSIPNIIGEDTTDSGVHACAHDAEILLEYGSTFPSNERAEFGSSTLVLTHTEFSENDMIAFGRKDVIPRHRQLPSKQSALQKIIRARHRALPGRRPDHWHWAGRGKLLKVKGADLSAGSMAMEEDERRTTGTNPPQDQLPLPTPPPQISHPPK